MVAAGPKLFEAWLAEQLADALEPSRVPPRAPAMTAWGGIASTLLAVAAALLIEPSLPLPQVLLTPRAWACRWRTRPG